MSDLSEFLLAHIAEDEAVARRAWPETWQVEGNNVVTAETGLRAGYEGLQMGVAHLAMTVGKYQTEARNAEHIARHDPARVLAECEAKRRIVAAHPLGDGYGASWDRDWVTGCLNCTRAGVDGEEIVTEGPCPTLRSLALPYADHPDYHDEWRP